jgi:hypothetical protein
VGGGFAPEGMATSANSENPKGFWERRDVRKLDDMLLRAAGCDWDKVERFSLDRIPADVVDRFNMEAGELLFRMDAHRPWFIKDPRVCLLAPMWLGLMEFPVCILVYRTPLEVANSLRIRNGFSISFGVALWEKYVVSALNATIGFPRLVIRHSDMLRNPLAVVMKLHSDLLELGVRGMREPSEKEVMRFIDPDLYRSKVDGKIGTNLLSSTQRNLMRIFEGDPLQLPSQVMGVSESSVETLLTFERERSQPF